MHQIGSTAIDRRPRLERRLAVSVAESRADIRAAQHLRYRVFVEELGARIGVLRSELERDRFDPFCEHLIVRDTRSDNVIGTYRLLTPERAERIGAFMSEGEFDLASLLAIRAHMVELGRACIDPDYRNGAALMLLWSGIARHVVKRGFRYLFGCASIGMGDGGDNAVRTSNALLRRYLAPPEYRVLPRMPLPPVTSETLAPQVVPPLVKGYLRLGAWICGEPAWDPEFNTADLLVLLPLERVEAKYARHFLRDAPDASLRCRRNSHEY